METETQEAAQPEAEAPEANAETQQEDATAASSGDDTAAQATDETKEEAKPRPRKRNRRSFDERIGQLTAQVRAHERTIEDLQVKGDPEPSAPKRDDFDDYEGFIEAKAEYSAGRAAEEKIAAADKARESAKTKESEDQQHHAYEQAREDMLDKGAEVYEDFEDVATSPDLQISPVMADALLTSKKGHDLWYHLGKNPEVAERISAMYPVQQLMELGRLESSLTVARKSSDAPAPTKKVQQRGPTNNTLSDKQDIKSWMNTRNEERRKTS